MLRGQRAVIKTSLLAMMAVATSGGLGYAQELDSAKVLSVDLTTRLQYDSNPDLAVGGSAGEFSVSERLDMTVLSETRTQQFDVSGGAEVMYTAADGIVTSRPDIRLRYSVERKNSSASAYFGLREADVTGFFDIDPSSAVILVSDPGSLRSLSGGASVNLSQNAPFTFSGSVDHTAIEVRNTFDPTLFNTFETTVSGNAGFRFSPVTQGTLRFEHDVYSAEDATQTLTNTTSANFSVSHEIKSALTVTGELGYLRRDLELSGTSTVRDGFRAGITVDQARPTGSVFGSVAYDQTGPSDRTSLTLGGTQQMPTATLDASVTAANVEGAGVQLIGNAGYTKQLADGAVSLNLNQAFETDQNDNETLTTRLAFGYQQDVTANSNLRVDLNYTRIEDAGNGTQPTQNRATLDAAYDRALTPDWNMTVGYTHRLLNDDAGSANSDSVYLSLTRNVQFGF